MIRNIIALISGVLIGVIVILIMETLGHLLFPIPANLDPTSAEDLKEYLNHAPLGAFLFVILAWGIGSFAGGGVAACIAREDQIPRALLTGFVLMAMGIANLLSIPHPVWFWILGLLVFIPSAYCGGSLVMRYKNKGKN